MDACSLYLSLGVAIIFGMVISVEQLRKNPYLFTNYVHQEVDLPRNTEFDGLKRDFYTRIETFMSSDNAQKAFEEVVEDKESLGLKAEARDKLSDGNLRKMHLQEAIDAVAGEAKDTLLYGKYIKTIFEASGEEYRRLTASLNGFEKEELSSIFMLELRFFKEGLSNALEFAFGFAGLIPKLYRKITGSNITADLFKEILKKNLKLLNVLCGMQIEIFNQFKQQVMDISKKENKIHEEGFELSDTDGLSLVPKLETAEALIETVKKKPLVVPVFGCPVLRVKYQKENVPFFDRMHQWVEDLIEKHIIKNLDSIMANTPGQS